MSVNKEQFKRFMKIDDKIKNGKKATVKQLLETWNNSVSDDHEKVTERTIYNDLKKIPVVFAGAIIEEDNKRYSYVDHSFSIKKLNLNENDETLLGLISMTLQNFENTEIYKKYNKLKKKVLQDISKGENTKYNFILPELSHGKSGYEWIETLFEAINKKETVDIVYQKYGQEPSNKSLSPYLLKENKKRWYLIAYDHAENRKCTKVYALDKIRDVKESETNYYYDPFFSPQDYFKYTYGIFHDLVNKPINVVLDFTGAYVDQLKNHPLMATQRNTLMKGGKVLRVELELYYSYEIIREILSFGSSVKVISPEMVSKEVKKAALKLAEQY
jgi:predicted DNA-binding transcriptional regulator YafY